MTDQDLLAPTCRGCALVEVCRDHRLACTVFARWVNTGKTSRAKRTATRSMYDHVFSEEDEAA